MPRGRFLEAIVRRRWLFALAMAAITSLVLASAIHLPLGYTGEATLERRVDAAAQEALIAPGESSDSLRQIIHNELVGPAAVRQAVGNLPPFAARGATDDEIQRIGKALTVEWDFRRDQADQIRVLCSDHDPLVAGQVPEALVHSYILRLSDRITQPLVVSRDAARGELDASTALVAELSKPQPVEEAKAIPPVAAPVPASPPAPAAATQALALRLEVDQIAAEIAAIRHR
ncbi:MAG: hypothetical protein NT049_17305, partial [Planctomycetota bacterium]|nr:hypothetical protein [Planctomycetota bacterium]